MKRYKPAQHCVWLCSEDRRIDNKSGVVHYECYPFRSSYIPSSLFPIFIHKHHFSTSLAASIWTWLATVPAAVPHANTGTIRGSLLRAGAAWSRWTMILFSILRKHEVEGKEKQHNLLVLHESYAIYGFPETQHGKLTDLFNKSCSLVKETFKINYFLYKNPKFLLSGHHKRAPCNPNHSKSYSQSIHHSYCTAI